MLLSACLVIASVAFPAPYARAITSTPIVIDGDLSDWTGVRADPDNASTDTQVNDPDPDYPGQPDRDVYLVNATWDNDFLYLAFRRTAGGTKAITFGAYIDRGGDGLLQDSDVCLAWTVSQGSTGRFADAHAPNPTARILRYNQARDGAGGPFIHPGGDPMGHDGETPDGWANIQSGEIVPQQPMDGWMAENGIEFEGRVAWSDLGLAPGSPIAVHFVNANGESWGKEGTPSTTHKMTGNPPQYLEENRGQIEDNVDDIWWLRMSGVSVTPDSALGGEAGQTLVYTHTITNLSNTADTFDLTAVSASGWPVQLTNAAGVQISSVSLAPDATATVRVRVTIPTGTSDGVHDVTTVTARSRADTSVTGTAADTTTCGRVTVTADQAGTMAPGQTASYVFTVTNNLPGMRTYDLTRLSSLGWPTEIRDAGGSPITSVTLASGAAATVIVRVSVPATAPVGAHDVTRLTAALHTDPSVRSSATAATTVRAGLLVTPDNAGFGGANTFVDYRHTVTNSWPATRTIQLTATSSRGWGVQFFATDGVTPLTSVTLGPNGDSVEVIARVAIPAGAASNLVDVTTVRATAGTATATATDTTTVRRLATYADGGYQQPATAFRLTDAIHARATGLRSGDDVTFIWKDPSGVVVRTSPDRTVDTAGMAFDDYSSLLTDDTGSWIIELRDSRNRLLETAAITLTWNATITALSASDAPRVGDVVAVTSSLTNHIARPVLGSTLTYTLWWDTDGDDVFDAGDTWIDSSGAPHVWNGTSSVSSHETTGVDVPAGGTWTEAAPWTVDNHLFPNQGTYRVNEVWRDATGLLIDTRTTQFYSIPALGWPLAGLFAIVAGCWMWRRRERLVPEAARS